MHYMVTNQKSHQENGTANLRQLTSNTGPLLPEPILWFQLSWGNLIITNNNLSHSATELPLNSAKELPLNLELINEIVMAKGDSAARKQRKIFCLYRRINSWYIPLSRDDWISNNIDHFSSALS